MKTKKRFPAALTGLCLLAVIAMGLYGWKLRSPDSGERSAATSAADSPESPYADILDAYAQALREQWDGAELMEAGLNYLAASFDTPLEEVGYLETDLDGDGTPELLVGTRTEEDDFFGKMVFSLYSLDGSGDPILVLDSTERNRYYYSGDNRFANLGSGAYNSSFETTVKLEDNEMIDMTYTTDPADYVQLELLPFSQRRR